MSIIYSYPIATPSSSDLFVFSDSSSTPKYATRQATLSSIKDALDVVDSLTAGAGISLSGSSLPTGDITIANTGVLSLSSDFGTYISGTDNGTATGAVDLGSIDLSAVDGTAVAATRFLSKDNTWDTPPTYTGGANIGYVTDGGSNTTFLRGDGTWVVPTNTTDITLTTTGTSGASTWDGTTLNIPQYSDGVDGSGTANQVPMWSDSDTLTDSIMKQVGTGVSAKLVIGGNPNNGLMFENTGTGIPDVTLLPFNGASGPNWDMRLPAPPTTGGQIMSLPSTLGSSPYQLEWQNKAVINSAGGTFLGIGTPTNTVANLALGSVATPLLNTTDLGDVNGLAAGQTPVKFIEVQIGATKYYMALYEQA